jgi:hypothetical protein
MMRLVLGFKCLIDDLGRVCLGILAEIPEILRGSSLQALQLIVY